MKAVLTFVLVLFFGATALAQDVKNDSKAEITVMGNELHGTSDTTTVNYREVSIKTESKVARLYKHKNARVKKALSFTTKNNKSKLV